VALNDLESVTLCISLFMYYCDDARGGIILAAPMVIAEGEAEEACGQEQDGSIAGEFEICWNTCQGPIGFMYLKTRL
jgi:hypothetical protein